LCRNRQSGPKQHRAQETTPQIDAFHLDSSPVKHDESQRFLQNQAWQNHALQNHE
jgi:hypothetical protein